jgi:DNA-binding XRE family transcriptional regulator
MVSRDFLYQYIGQQIKEIRSLNGLRQEDLAHSVDLQRSSIAQIEAGKQAPSLFLLYQMCEVLNTPITAILPTSQQEPSKNEFDNLSITRVKDKDAFFAVINRGNENGSARHSI